MARMTGVIPRCYIQKQPLSVCFSASFCKKLSRIQIHDRDMPLEKKKTPWIKGGQTMGEQKEVEIYIS